MPNLLVHFCCTILILNAVLVFEPCEAKLFSSIFTYEDGVYKVSSFRTDWTSARGFCKLNQGELLSIETLGENAAILDAIKGYSSESFWTSGTSKFQSAGNFYWDATGAAMGPYTNWGPNEPLGGDYVELSSSKNHLWSVVEYSVKENLFICEFHPCLGVPMELSSGSIQNDTDGDKEKLSESLRFNFGNHAYEISSSKRNWLQARNDCKAKGMQLVSIESSEENSAILEAIVHAGEMKHNFWTSGVDLAHEGNFQWEATGQAAGPFSNWAPEEPNNQGHNEHCMGLWSKYDHKWNDFVCTDKLHYICEMHTCL